ncbi:hypothetical protein GGI12_000378 [Dipsacomyces acuminosporus]|nr:hypothetical protein GGI12_000378 [Dipsacomyces acuminosporus]
MHAMGVKSKELDTGVLSRASSLPLSIWMWATAVPRGIISYIFGRLAALEDALVALVWAYQGENILKFFYTRGYLKPLPAPELQAPASTGRADPQASTVSCGVQTDEQDLHGMAREARLRRDVLMGKVLDELVPALLQALHAMPKKGELEKMSSEYHAWIEAVHEQQRKLLEDQTSYMAEKDSWCDEYETTAAERMSSTQIASTLDALVARVGTMDERLIRLLGNDASLGQRESEVSEKLSDLMDDLGYVRSEYENDRVLVLELAQRVVKLDAILSTADISALSPVAAARQTIDVAVSAHGFCSDTEKEEVEEEEEEEEEIIDDSSIRSIKSKVLDSGKDGEKTQDGITTSKDEMDDAHLAPLPAVAASDSAASPKPFPQGKDDAAHTPAAKPATTAAARTMPVEARKSTGSMPTGQHVSKPRRSSFREEVKRHLWFGKKSSTKHK